VENDPNPDWVHDHCRVIGVRVRNARADAKLTQEQLAERAGVSWRYIHRVEHGTTGSSIGALLRIARALHVSLADLVQ
jgi:transcriptional regulator with XRE-family HTH domain